MSIFDGVEPPHWLQQIAKPVDAKESGAEIGMLLGGGLRALQPDEEAQPDANGKLPMKGLEKGYNEARMAHADPEWRLKHKALELGVVNKWADAATSWQTYDFQARDTAEWLNHDLKVLSEHAEAAKKDPNTPLTEPMHSARGMQAAAQLERAQIAAQNLKLRQDNAKTVLENQKTSSAFNQALSAAPLTIQSAADELPNQGWNVDQSGRRTTPSMALLRLYNDWATDNGKNPTKAFGYKPTSLEVQDARNKGTISAIEERGKNQLANIEARHVARMAEMAKNAEYQKDLKAITAAGVGGKGGVSLETFINRQMQGMIKVVKDEGKITDHAAIVKEAQYELTKAYDRMVEDMKDRARATAPAKPAATGTTNAVSSKASAPDKPSKNNDDPMGLFQ
jgi:hypothetical protein